MAFTVVAESGEGSGGGHGYTVGEQGEGWKKEGHGWGEGGGLEKPGQGGRRRHGRQGRQRMRATVLGDRLGIAANAVKLPVMLAWTGASRVRSPLAVCNQRMN